METLNISKANALKAFAKGSDENRKFLQDLFPDQNFKLNSLDRIKSYEDACEDQGKQELEIDDLDIFDEDERYYMYRVHRVTTIIRSLNRLDDGSYWKPDWNNREEDKWYIVYIWSGAGFSFGDDDYVYGRSDVGSRLSFRTKEALLYFKDNFMNEANEFLTL